MTNDDQTEMIPQLPIGDTQPMPMPLQFATVAPAGAHGARHARTRPTRMVEPSTVSTASRWGARTLLGFTLVTAALIGSGIGLALPTPGAPRLDDVPTTVVPLPATVESMTEKPTTTTVVQPQPERRNLNPVPGATPSGATDREPPQPAPQPERTRTTPPEPEERATSTPPVTGSSIPATTPPKRSTPTDGGG